MSEKKYVPQFSLIMCDKGTFPTPLRVTLPSTELFAFPMATEIDKFPFLNIVPFGICSCLTKTFPVPCVPSPIMWENVQEGVTHMGFRMLKEDSTIRCAFGGEISITMTLQAALGEGANALGELNKFIEKGFNWYFEEKEKARAQRDSWLPDFLEPVAHAADWFEDFGDGMVEGAVSNVVGLGEAVLHIASDPEGTLDAIGDMVSDGWDATKKGVSTAWDWASEGENWSQAADDAWNWASDGDNWVQAASDAKKAVGDGAKWVADNPRKLGKVTGEIALDVGAAALTGGSSTAASATKVVVRETVETAIIRGGRKLLQEGVENKLQKKVATELGEEAAQKAAKEAATEMPEVVVKQADEIIEIKGGKKGEGWSKALNGELLPNTQYLVDGYLYKTDGLGRVKSVSGKLRLNPRGRNTYQQGKSVDLKDGLDGDQGGHLIGDRFDGPGEQINYVPQKGSLNQGAYKKLENKWAKALEENKTVEVKIENIYSGDSKRPIGQTVESTIDGKTTRTDFFN